MRTLVMTLVAVLAAVPCIATPAQAAPAPQAEGFKALTEQAEQQRAAGDHTAAARSFKAAFGALSQADQADLLGEITVNNAIDEYKLAQAAAGADELTLLYEEADLLESFASNPLRTGLMPFGMNEEHARTAVRTVELERAQGGDGGATTPPSTRPTTPPAPTSSKAPAPTTTPSKSPAPTTPPSKQPTATEPTTAAKPEALSLEDERRLAAPGNAFRRHALGAHGGITIIPSWLLSRWAATHTNALCRGSTIGSFAAKQGLLRQEGCNFYAGVDYVYRFSRVIDMRASVQYQRFKLPDGLWLDRTRDDGSAPGLETADYTEVDLGLLAMEVDFIARAPVVVAKNVELGLGGGAGLGLGVVLGGVHRTPLGADPQGFRPSGGPTPGTCQSLEDLADLTRCTPRYDADSDADGVPPAPSELRSPNPELFATCTRTECSESDLRAFGYRRAQASIPPVIPVVSLILSARLLIKDAVGITLDGGFGTGFYFGGGLQYFFGQAKPDEAGRRAASRPAR